MIDTITHINLNTGIVSRLENDGTLITSVTPILEIIPSLIKGDRPFLFESEPYFLNAVIAEKRAVASIYTTIKNYQVPVKTISIVLAEDVSLKSWQTLHVGHEHLLKTNINIPPIAVPWCIERSEEGAKHCNTEWFSDFQLYFVFAYLQYVEQQLAVKH